MTLTELRCRLEELELQGHGERGVQVSPAPAPGWPNISEEDEKKYRLNFTLMTYVVCSADVRSEDFEMPVTLTFTEAWEMPEDPDFREDGMFENW